MNQLKLANRFKLRDLEVGLCKSCNVYYDMPMNPRDRCLACHKEGASKEEKAARFKRSREMEGCSRGRQDRKERSMLERQKELKEIRAAIKFIPVLVKKIEVPVEGIDRCCLNCHSKFRAKTRFNRLCTGCNVWSEEQGMTDYVHYIGC